MTHRTYRTLVALVCFMLLLTLGALPIAAEEDLLQQNRAAAQEAKSALDELITYYDSKENATSKLPADKTILTLTAYQAEIDALFSSNIHNARYEDLSPRISLLRAKGELAAKLTWIAYLHGVIEQETATDIVFEQYSGLLQSVRNASDQASLATIADNACIAMNQTVFKQKINRLPRELNVAEVHVLDHLKEARIKIDTTLSPSVDGEEYLAIYRQTKDLIVLEQGRLASKQEFSDVYDLLGLPSADKLTALSTLASSLADATSTAQINALLLSAVRDRLQAALPEMGKHTAEYRQGLEQAMTSAVQAAGNDRIADLTPYLDGTHASFPEKPFSLRAEIALAKDRIEALRDPADDPMLLAGIVGDYVATGGILDRCDSREALDFEVMIASFRVNWARKKPLYLSKIGQILPTASSDALQLQVKTVYDTVDAALCALSMGAENQPTPDALVNDGIAQLDDLVCEAEAEHFCITHADVLNKTHFADVVRTQLEAAIESFDRLSAQTQAKLGDEKIILCEHYKSLIAHAIEDYLNEDGTALRQEALTLLHRRVTSLSATEARPSALRAEADESLIRAAAVDALLDRYAQTCAQAHYPQYDSDSVSLLQRIVQTAVDSLLDPTKTDVEATGSRKTVESVLQTQILEIERRTAIAELRLSADGSSLENIKALLTSATDSILQATDKQTVESIRDAAVFRMAAYRKADRMRSELNDLKSAILALRALSNQQKQAILESDAMLTLTSACTQAENAPDADTLMTLAASFANGKQALLIEAEELALRTGVESAQNEISAEAEAISKHIKALQYLTEDERNAYTDRLDTVVSQWRAGIQTPSVTWELLDTELLEIRESIMGIFASAQTSDQSAYRTVILADWQAKYAKKEAYSASCYDTVSALLKEGEELLKNAMETEALKAVRLTVEQRLSAIPTRLDEAKSEAKSTLQSTYELLLTKENLYAPSSWETIESLYRSALESLDAFTLLSDIPSALNIAIEACQRMQKICISRLYSCENAMGENGDLIPAYPSGYQADRDGYWATLSCPDAIPFDGSFVFKRFDASQRTNTLQAIIRRKAIVNANGEVLSAELLSSLKDGILTDGLSFTYTASENSALPSYLISILLPEGYDADGILGIVFMIDDNNAEFYNATVVGNVLSFEVSHLSEFYIVSKKTIDISPLILTLAIILLCEIVAILLILSRRKSKASQNHTAAFLPMLPFAASVRITPQGGVLAVVVLAVCILIATAVLVWLIINERARHVPTQTAAALGAASTTGREIVLAEQALEIDNPVPAAPADSYEPLSAVTAELANAMMSDAEVQRVKENAAARPSAHQTRSVGKKHAVNIDVISKSFDAYDTVSLSALKKRGLIPQSAQAIKILARGTLDKPLTVVANDFSATAIKMILLTGGEVITAE